MVLVGRLAIAGLVRAPRLLLRLLRYTLPVLPLLQRRLVCLFLPRHGVASQRPHMLVERVDEEPELAVADGAELPQQEALAVGVCKDHAAPGRCRREGAGGAGDDARDGHERRPRGEARRLRASGGTRRCNG